VGILAGGRRGIEKSYVAPTVWFGDHDVGFLSGMHQKQLRSQRTLLSGWARTAWRWARLLSMM
jgi:hypothetical protein